MRILVILGVIAEVALLLAGGVYALHRIRERRRSRAAGDTAAPGAGPAERPHRALSGLEGALGWGLPAPLARFLILEPRLWWCFGTWLLRRGPKGPDVFPYHKRSPMGAMLVVVFLTTPVEILLFELLIPVFWIRVLLLVAAVYALFFVLALYASMIVLPHHVTAGGLLIRYGAMAEVWVPFQRILVARAERRDGPRGSLGLPREGLLVDGDQAMFVMGGKTDVTVEFDGALPLTRLRGDYPVLRVHLAVDAPEALLEAIRMGTERLRHPQVPTYTPGVTSIDNEAEASSPR